MMEGQILQKNVTKNALHPKTKSKDRFQIESDKQIELILKSLSFDDEDPSHNQYMTPEMKCAKKREELREEAGPSELANYVESSFRILSAEGRNYLTVEEYESMSQAFAHAHEILDEINLDVPFTENFQTILHFNNSIIEYIFKIAVEKYKELQYQDSLSIFILLFMLVPENPDYLYRAALVARECKKYELASRFFSATSSIDPLLIAPWIFSTECYLKQNLEAEAQASYAEAIKISETSQIDDEWKNALSSLKALIS